MEKSLENQDYQILIVQLFKVNTENMLTLEYFSTPKPDF